MQITGSLESQERCDFMIKFIQRIKENKRKQQEEREYRKVMYARLEEEYNNFMQVSTEVNNKLDNLIKGE